MAHTYGVTASDPDGDQLTYWWTFTEGTLWTNSSFQNPVYTYNTMQSSLGYSVSVSDGLAGHNITRTGYLTANMAPTIHSTPGSTVTDIGLSNSFSVSAWDDDDNLTLNYIWDFGDGSPWSTTVGIPSASHTFSAVGNYSVMVFVDDLFVDMDGVPHNISTTLSTVRVYTTHLNLVVGWNLVTLPPIGNGYKAGNMGLLPGDVVSGYNPATKTYDKNFIVGVSPPPLDFAIAGSTGYWINVKVNETLHLYGTVPTTTQTRTITLPAGGGWFILGLNTMKTTLKASNIPAMYSGGSIVTVAAYNPATGAYKSYIAGVPPTDYALVPAQAYWCYANASGTLTYTP
jgi:PKD repeat protein